MNGLYEINTSVKDSMVFVNFDAGNEVVPFECPKGGILGKSGLCNRTYITECQSEGFFNWKLGGMYYIVLR